MSSKLRPMLITLSQILGEHNWSLEELSLRSGISIEVLEGIFSNSYMISWTDARAFSATLGHNPEFWMRQDNLI